ncbi:MAG TPA: head GIN domain-containing protein [Allosphingosinicella sp.]|nr:head GIN domain-containing protein [Allosphingosinicella sp.]
MRSAIALVSAIILTACNAADAQKGESAEASGAGTERSFQVGSFDSVALGGHHNVVVTVGGAPSVRAEGDERELADLEISTRGSELRIGTKDHTGWRGRRHAVTVYVTLPALTKASIGGSGDMRIDNVQGSRFEAAIGGSGNIEIASLRVQDGRFAVAGSGNIRASGGQAQSTDISIAGSGDIDLGGVESRNAEVSVVGSGDVRLRASEAASVTVMGSGDVNVAGPARCSVRKMGSGDVHCEA